MIRNRIRYLTGVNFMSDALESGLVSPVPPLRLISDYVDYHSEHRPDAVAMTLGTAALTYAELAERVRATANALLADGVGRGDRVAFLAKSTPDFMVNFLAAASIGAIWMGLNPKYRQEELRYVVDDAQPCLVFSFVDDSDRDYLAELQQFQKEIPGIRRVISNGADFDDWIETGRQVSAEDLAATTQAVQADDPALLVYTSGTTGQPKGAMLPHRGLVKAALVQYRYWGADPLVMQNYFPINHLACVGDVSCLVYVNGGRLTFMEEFDAAAVIRQLGEEGITTWAGIPTTFQMCLDHPDWEKADTSSLQIIAFGGAAAPRPLVERLIEIVPRVSNAYGQTETVAQVTFTPPCDEVDVLVKTIGKPVPDYEVMVVRDDGVVADIDEEGEIRVRGDFIMNGYWRRPEATAEALTEDGWLCTGDLARRRADGNLEIVGRLKEMFKSGGYNVYPLEVEQVLELLDGVAAAIVVPVPDPLYNEVGHAFIQLVPGCDLTIEELRLHCREKLANYKIPKEFQLVGKLPLLPVGKVDRGSMKKMALDQLAESTE